MCKNIFPRYFISRNMNGFVLQVLNIIIINYLPLSRAIIVIGGKASNEWRRLRNGQSELVAFSESFGLENRENLGEIRGGLFLWCSAWKNTSRPVGRGGKKHCWPWGAPSKQVVSVWTTSRQVGPPCLTEWQLILTETVSLSIFLVYLLILFKWINNSAAYILCNSSCKN